MDEALHRTDAARRRLVAFALLAAVGSLAAGCGSASRDEASTAPTRVRVMPHLKGAKLPALTGFRKTRDGSLAATISSDFLFGLDNATVVPRSEIRIRQTLVPEILGRLHEKRTHLLINGYADAPGTVAHNLDLSLRRAEAVERILVDAGVPAAQMTAKGFGEQGAGTHADPSRRKVVLVIPGASG